MSEAIRRMTLDKFDEWQPLQDVRCELVDGLVFAMKGATFAHNIVVGNLFFKLAQRLREKDRECRPFTADIGFTRAGRGWFGMSRFSVDDGMSDAANGWLRSEAGNERLSV